MREPLGVAAASVVTRRTTRPMYRDPTCDECGDELGDELITSEEEDDDLTVRTVHTRCSREAKRYDHFVATGQTAQFTIAPGWPRPTNTDGHPVPFVVPSPDELAHLDYARNSLCALRGLCVVCGLSITGQTCFVAIDERSRVSTDHALTHERCARMAVARCPHLNGLLVSRWGTRVTMAEVGTSVAVKVARLGVNGDPAPPLEPGEIRRTLPT